MKIVVSGQLAYTLKVGLKLLGCADGLDEESERSRGCKDDSKALGLSNLQLSLLR